MNNVKALHVCKVPHGAGVFREYNYCVATERKITILL